MTAAANTTAPMILCAAEGRLRPATHLSRTTGTLSANSIAERLVQICDYEVTFRWRGAIDKSTRGHAAVGVRCFNFQFGRT
jgi:hypothetical protein